MKVLSSLLVLVFSTALQTATADESPVPRQLHPAAACKDADTTWFAEYKTGITEEFTSYESLAGPAYQAAKAGDDMAAAGITRTMIEGGWYRHNHWDMMANPTAVFGAGISPDDYEGIDHCRTAIIDLKFFIVAASSARFDSDGWSDWKDFSRQCRAYMGNARRRKKIDFQRACCSRSRSLVGSDFQLSKTSCILARIASSRVSVRDSCTVVFSPSLASTFLVKASVLSV